MKKVVKLSVLCGIFIFAYTLNFGSSLKQSEIRSSFGMWSWGMTSARAEMDRECPADECFVITPPPPSPPSFPPFLPPPEPPLPPPGYGGGGGSVPPDDFDETGADDPLNDSFKQKLITATLELKLALNVDLFELNSEGRTIRAMIATRMEGLITVLEVTLTTARTIEDEAAKWEAEVLSFLIGERTYSTGRTALRKLMGYRRFTNLPSAALALVATHPVQNAGYDVIDYLEDILDRNFRAEPQPPAPEPPPCEGCEIR